jgi:CRP/FNR family transcriptional regulator, cyclic AMP receptor protein
MSKQQQQIDAYAKVLAKVPLFTDLGRRELQRLAATCVERDYSAGSVLVRQGQPGVGLFIVVSGHARVGQEDAHGDIRELALLGPGDVFGELSLLDDLPRSASVIATEPVRALLLPVYDFRAALREDGDMCIRLLAVLSRRLRRAEQRQA